MYTVRKLALVALIATTSTLSSPVSAGLLPPPVECVDGKIVGDNLPIETLPDPFTIQVIPRDDEPGSLPLVLGEQLGSSDFNRVKLGHTSDPGLSFTLTNSQVDYKDDLKLTLVKGVEGYTRNTQDLGTGPGFPDAHDFVAEYACRSDNTPVLVLVLSDFAGNPTNNYFELLTSGFEPGNRITIVDHLSQDDLFLTIIGGGELL